MRWARKSGSFICLGSQSEITPTPWMTGSLLVEGGFGPGGNRLSQTLGGVTTQCLNGVLNSTGLPQIVDKLQNGSVARGYSNGLESVSENQLIGGTSYFWDVLRVWL